MTDKDFKKIITDLEENNKNKEHITSVGNKLIDDIKTYLPKGIEVTNKSLASWHAFGLYNEPNKIYLALDLSINTTNNIYMNNAIFNSIEVALILMNATKIEKTSHTISFMLNDDSYLLELRSNDTTPTSYVSKYQKVLDEESKQYTIIKNALNLINYFIISEDIKNINTYLIINLLIKGIKKDQVENKYYKYLSSFLKMLDELLNTKKYEISELFESDVLMNINLSETKLAEYRKLRKAISKAISVEEETVKFDSQTEVVVDVNPLYDETQKTFAWHYSLIGRNNENAGGVYQNTEVEYQTAVLKGVFKGLKAVVDSNLCKKKIILKCNYEGILTDKMLSNDENKSRMKTINKMIEANNLKIQTR